jgi:hypothetical protein
LTETPINFSRALLRRFHDRQNRSFSSSIRHNFDDEDDDEDEHEDPGKLFKQGF